jgi:acetoacetyl-CoA synthetase
MKTESQIQADHSRPMHPPGMCRPRSLPVPDIPYTLNMKKVELAVKKVIQNQAVSNKDALRNPDSGLCKDISG